MASKVKTSVSRTEITARWCDVPLRFCLSFPQGTCCSGSTHHQQNDFKVTAASRTELIARTESSRRGQAGLLRSQKLPDPRLREIQHLSQLRSAVGLAFGRRLRFHQPP